jgi:hypothetical protein
VRLGVEIHTMDFIDELEELSERVVQHEESDNLKTEEATKHSLIMPFIKALGYDIFDPNEVIPEFTADVGTKKGEKVDYAIRKEGEIVVLVECKRAGRSLDRDDASQLYRYFTTTHGSRIAMLTNGVRHEFYSDIEKDNVMDEKPFLEVDMREIEEGDPEIQELRKLKKSNFELDEVLERASNLKYSRAFKKILDRQFDEPEDEFVRFFAKQVYDGRLTQNRKDEFREILHDAMNEYLSMQIRDTFNAAAAQEQQKMEEATEAEEEDSVDDEGDEEDDGIVTTEEEIEGYHIVKAIMSEVCDPSRVEMRDAKSYCAILFDDNNRQPICRFYFDYKTKMKVGLFDEEKNEEKVEIETLDDLHDYAEEFQRTAFFYDEELREEYKDQVEEEDGSPVGAEASEPGLSDVFG